MLRVVLVACLSVIAANGSTYKSEMSPYVLASGYSAQIYAYSVDGGALTQIATWDVDPNLTWIQQVGNSFYASHEVMDFEGVDGAAVSRWEVVDGNLERKEYISLEKGGTAYVLIDTDHNMGYTANYGSGSVTVFSLNDDGSLGAVTQILEYGEGCRDASHPHEIVRVGDLVWVVDLGCDSVYNYRLNGDQLESIGAVAVTDGAGPRHMIPDTDKNLMFLVCELINLIQVYSYDADGNMQFLEETARADVDGQSGAEVLLSADKNFLYVSSRGEGVIAVFAIEDSSLNKIQEVELFGTWPRSVDISGDVMVVADKEGDALQLLSIDSSTGMLTPGETFGTTQYPAFVMFYD